MDHIYNGLAWLALMIVTATVALFPYFAITSFVQGVAEGRIGSSYRIYKAPDYYKVNPPIDTTGVNG